MDREEKIKEIINLVNSKDLSYKSIAQELIQALKDIEKKNETSETQLTAVLLNFILGNYSLYGLNFNLISKETKEALEKLLKALYDNVLPNAYSLAPLSVNEVTRWSRGLKKLIVAIRERILPGACYAFNICINPCDNPLCFSI